MIVPVALRVTDGPPAADVAVGDRVGVGRLEGGRRGRRLGEQGQERLAFASLLREAILGAWDQFNDRHGSDSPYAFALIGGQAGTLADLTGQYERYVASGEINSTVQDQAGRVLAVREAFANRTRSTDELDGLTVELDDGSWFNVRASNTEPLLRLNVEAPDEAAMRRVRDEALSVIHA